LQLRIFKSFFTSFFLSHFMSMSPNEFIWRTDGEIFGLFSLFCCVALLSGNFAFDFKVKSFDWKEHAYKYSIFYFEFFSSFVEVLGKTHYLLCCQCFQFVTYLSTFLNKFIRLSKLLIHIKVDHLIGQTIVYLVKWLLYLLIHNLLTYPKETFSILVLSEILSFLSFFIANPICHSCKNWWDQCNSFSRR